MDYRIAPGWINALRWAILRRVKPFSRRVRWAGVIGWPRTEAVNDGVPGADFSVLAVDVTNFTQRRW